MTNEERIPLKPLGFVLWAFIVFQVISAFMILDSLSVILLPELRSMIAEAGASDMLPSTTDVIVGIVQVLVIAAGVVLLLRRHPAARRYWIAALGVASAWYLLQALSGASLAAIELVVSGVWLAYWITARRPRELELGGIRK